MSYVPLPLSEKFDTIALISLIALIGLVAVYFGELPEEVPAHFDFNGEADRYASKSILLFIPVLAVGLYAFMGWLSKLSSYKKGQRNFWSTARPAPGMEAAYQATSLEMIGYLRAVAMLALSFTVWASIQTAVTGVNRFGAFFLPVLLLLLLPTVYYTWKLLKMSD